MRKTPFLALQPFRKRPLDVAGLRAHCALQVENGQAAQTVESLLDLVAALAERCDRQELLLARLAHAQWGKRVRESLLRSSCWPFLPSQMCLNFLLRRS